MLSLSDCTQSNCSNPTPWITIFIIIIVVVIVLGLVVGARKRRNKR
jgi:LPXTG-motif cell wall-anchored protein